MQAVATRQPNTGLWQPTHPNQGKTKDEKGPIHTTRTQQKTKTQAMEQSTGRAYRTPDTKYNRDPSDTKQPPSNVTQQPTPTTPAQKRSGYQSKNNSQHNNNKNMEEPDRTP